MRVREATRDDAAAIAQLHLDNWRGHYRGMMPDDALDAITYASRLAHWDGVFADGSEFVYVIEEGDGRQVRGIASGGAVLHDEPDYRGELYVLHVRPEMRGQGAGRALVGAIARRLADESIGSMLVWVLRDNHSARRFYERLGGQFVRAQATPFQGVMLPEVGYGWRDTATLLRGEPS